MARIAVLEGSPDIAQLVALVLQDAGHEAMPISEPGDAVDRVTREAPDLVILDPWFTAPETGWEILLLLMADERTRGIPVIIYSGDPHDIRERQGWLDEHRIAALEKPFDLADLEDAVAHKLAG